MVGVRDCIMIGRSISRNIIRPFEIEGLVNGRLGEKARVEYDACGTKPGAKLTWRSQVRNLIHPRALPTSSRPNIDSRLGLRDKPEHLATATAKLLVQSIIVQLAKDAGRSPTAPKSERTIFPAVLTPKLLASISDWVQTRD